MKKSNIVLVVAIITACVWTLLIFWLCAASIDRYREGKELIFTKSYKQYLENQKQTFQTPSNELIISGDGTTSLEITHSKELSVIANKKLLTCTWSDLKNGISKISLWSLYDHKDYYEWVQIRLPEIRMLTVDNCAEVRIKDFNRKNLNITCDRVYTFSIDSCRIGSLNLDISRNQPDAEILVKKDNKIDTLIACIQGSYRLKLDTIGKIKNHLRVSDSVQIIARGNLYKNLSVEHAFRQEIK
jgi:hypothetical protein